MLRVVVGALLATAGCSPPPFTCAFDDDCIDENNAEGLCEPARVCSFADATCASGWRYATHAGAESEQCVNEVPRSTFLGAVSGAMSDVASVAVDISGLPQSSAGASRWLIVLSATVNYASTVVVDSATSDWTRIAEQCGARKRTGIAIWFSSDTRDSRVTVEFASQQKSVLAVVAAFETTTGANRVDSLSTANALGPNGPCTDSDQSIDTNTVEIPVRRRHGGSVLVAVAPRNRTVEPERNWTTFVAEAFEGNNAEVRVTLAGVPLPVPSSIRGSIGATPGEWAAAALEVY